MRLVLVLRVWKLWTVAVMTIIKVMIMRAYSPLKKYDSGIDQPRRGWAARSIRCVYKRLRMKRMITPAATNTWAAIASLVLVGRVAHAILKMLATVRAMQKPKVAAEGMNLWPRDLFNLKRRI